MIKKIEKIPFVVLLLAAFVTTALAFVVKGGVNWHKETSARKDGSLVTIDMAVEDFVIDGMRQSGDSWQTTDGDPKMMCNISGGFTGISFKADYLVYPGDIILYYLTQPGEGFSQQKRLYVSQDKDDRTIYHCSMPATYVVDIRLDPTTIAGNVIDFDSVTINPPLTLADYLAVTPYNLLMWGIYSLLLAAIFHFVQEFFTKKFE